jgi:hypothetical protein
MSDYNVMRTKKMVVVYLVSVYFYLFCTVKYGMFYSVSHQYPKKILDTYLHKKYNRVTKSPSQKNATKQKMLQSFKTQN